MRQLPEKPFELSAPTATLDLLVSAIDPEHWVDDLETPKRDVFHLYHLSSYILAPEDGKRFRDWFDKSLARLEILAPSAELKPYGWPNSAPEDELDAYLLEIWGQPVPPEILRNDIKRDERNAIYQAWISSVDWNENPFVTAENV